MAKKYTTYYVDTLTGKRVSKRKWKANPRKRTGLGKRYVKKRTPIKIKPPSGPVVGTIFEWIVNFSYEKSGRSFDVIVTSTDESDAYNQAKNFLESDSKAERIVKSNFRGWTPSLARGRKTDVQTEPEYRNESEA